jgi:hypothetical protein
VARSGPELLAPVLPVADPVQEVPPGTTPWPQPMRAVQITRFDGPEVLDVVDIPEPVPGPGQKLFGVSTAGVNDADTHHRLSSN